MNDNSYSDESIVPAKRANNDATEASAEPVEERDSTKRVKIRGQGAFRVAWRNLSCIISRYA